MKHFPILLATLLVCPLMAQPFQTKSLTQEDGLSHGYVSALKQDSRGFVWIGTIYGLNRYDGTKVKSYLPNHLEATSLHANIITDIIEDKNGLIWLGTDNGITIFHPVLEKFILLSKLNQNAPSGIVRNLILDDEGNLWCIQIAESGHKILKIINHSGVKNYFNGDLPAPTPFEIKYFSLPEHFGTQIRLFFKTDENLGYLVNTSGNLFKINLNSGTISSLSPPYPFALSGQDGIVPFYPNHDFSNPIPLDKRCIILKNKQGKEYYFNFFDKKIYSVSSRGFIRDGFEKSKIPVIETLDQSQSSARMIDNNGKIWVGTIGEGVRILEPVQTAFRHHFLEINFCNPVIMPDGKIWAGMYSPDKMLDLKTGQHSKPPWAGAIPAQASVNAALYDSLTYAVFLVIKNPDNTLSFQKYNLKNGNLRLLKNLKYPTSDPVILQKDSKGKIWLGGANGEVLCYHPNTQATEQWNTSHLITAAGKHDRQISRCIAEDSKGRIWIAGDAGLTCISPEKGKPEFKVYHNSGPKGPIFRNNWIFSVYPDPENADLLWLGTLSGGLAKFDVSTEKIEYICSQSIQPFDVVTAIIPDETGNLWLSTNKGLFKYQPTSNTLVDYSKLSHIPRIDINAAGCRRTPSGTLLFGGANGMIAVEPSQIKPAQALGNLVFTEININRTPTRQGISDRKILWEDPLRLALELRHDDRFIGLDFSMPAAANPEELLYRYKMEGFIKDWINLGQNRQIEFTELPPGSYSLEIQARGPGDSWENAKSLALPIHVSPPWYAGKLAWFTYFILFITATFFFFKYQQNRLALKLNADFNRKEMERLQSMDDFKNRFFAYIAHEFKTPLTIIMGAGEKLRRSLKSEASTEYPSAILRESNNMLRLIHELIDVTRLQDKSIRPNYERKDAVQFLGKIIESFDSLASLHKIHLQFKSTVESCYIDFDPQRTQYILNNIISNAIRYTNTEGSVTISLDIFDAERIQIRISDTGQGIPEEKLSHIFEKYYRANEEKDVYHNFGLGLSFVKELADLLHCTISVESSVGKGTTFLISLPRNAPAGVPIMVNELVEESGFKGVDDYNAPKAAANAASLLIVEDNPNIQPYLKSILQPHFNIFLAKNGKEGLDLAIREIPDLILTDVMMPEMDGIEMTAQIKSNILTSHIPVLMLSAKNEIQDRIKGQEQGADIYLGKPFYEQELVMALLNLHKLQHNWKIRYASLASGDSTLEQVADMPECFNQFTVAQNDLFMQQVLDAFEKHYATENFDAVELANAMNISKAQLYRKVSKISEEGVMGLLRNYRLMKAVELLDGQPSMSTKEIAFKVGFKEYSHFSSSFKKLLQVSPTEWRKSRIAPRAS